MNPFAKAEFRFQDSQYIDTIFNQETKRIDHYLAKASDTSASLKNRKVAAKIAAALLESALFSKESLPE